MWLLARHWLARIHVCVCELSWGGGVLDTKGVGERVRMVMNKKNRLVGIMSLTCFSLLFH